MNLPTIEVGLDEVEEVLTDNLMLLEELVGTGLSNAIGYAHDAARMAADELLPLDHPLRQRILDTLQCYDEDALSTDNPKAKNALEQLYLDLQELTAGRAIQP